jgi:hypothetical protein
VGNKPPYLVSVARERNLDDAHGGRGWLANLSRLRWLVANRPPVPAEEFPTANRDPRG